MNDKELLSVADQFRRGVLGRRTSGNWCYAISAPLAGYLEFCGSRCRLVEGSIEGNEHYWIDLLDGQILDPTADQFGEGMPEIYIGEKPSHYIAK